MHNTQRRKQILESIKAQGGISVGEIAGRFGVAKMTAHRDLEHLEKRGMIKRIFGGAVLAGDRGAAPVVLPGEGTGNLPVCTVCLRPPQANLCYTLTLTSGEERLTCCPHCGISAQLVLGDQVAAAICVDYLSGRPQPASASIFLFGSAAAPCCHPSILTFENEEMARRFQTGFGGSLGTFGDAMHFLRKAMSIGGGGAGCPHCATVENGNG